MAEFLIITNWTRNQRIVYRTLRLMKKMIQTKHKDIQTRDNGTVLSTYYFKTLMLWACEQRPVDFWDESRLVSTVQELLMEVVEW